MYAQESTFSLFYFFVVVTLFLSIFVLIGASVVIFFVCFYTHTKKKEIVLQNSERIKALMVINSKTNFKTINSSLTYKHSCKSKHQLDNYQIDDFFISVILSDEALFNNIVYIIEYNRKEYDSYIRTISNIKSTATEEYCKNFKIKLDSFLKLEEKLFVASILEKPVLYAYIHCIVSFCSPKGRSYYKKEKTYDFDWIKYFIGVAKRTKSTQEAHQLQIKAERAKMTDSLRYDILKRDNFRCQICGATAQDGVKLHVDHIVPVSKGGKSVPSNLRVLCERCNLGKSDKM